MNLTTSYSEQFSEPIRTRYEFRETRNAAAILRSTNLAELNSLIAKLDTFSLSETDVTGAGGNESDLVSRLNDIFRRDGWREGRCDTRITAALKLSPYQPAGETETREITTEVENKGYKVDHIRARVALDVEWNAKDGNLDRDIGAYRALYDAGIIDLGIIITRTHADLRAAALQRNPNSTKFATSTTTNLDKLVPRLTRGDAGGCPVLAIAITARCIGEPASD